MSSSVPQGNIHHDLGGDSRRDNVENATPVALHFATALKDKVANLVNSSFLDNIQEVVEEVVKQVVEKVVKVDDEEKRVRTVEMLNSIALSVRELAKIVDLQATTLKDRTNDLDIQLQETMKALKKNDEALKTNDEVLKQAMKALKDNEAVCAQSMQFARELQGALM